MIEILNANIEQTIQKQLAAMNLNQENALFEIGHPRCQCLFSRASAGNEWLNYKWK